MELRPPQIAACKAAYEDLKEVDSTLLVVATGVGKTIIAAALANRWKNEGSRVLFLAHRNSLISQAVDKFDKARGVKCGVEKADSSYDHKETPVCVASIQSLQGKRLEAFDRKLFDYIITDEAHRSVASTYMNIYNHFSSAKRLGITATAYRQKGSLSRVYKKISYEYNLRDSINDGFLSRIVAQTIPLKIDLHSSVSGDQDYLADDIASSIEPFLTAIACEIELILRGRKTMVFLPLVSTSKLFTEILRSKGIRAYHADGKDNRGVRGFEADTRGSVLCNSMLCTEGYDHPPVDCIIVLRPTKSTSLYSQMIGRGTRLCEGKDNCLVLDFLWNSEEHDLCRPACLVAETDDIEAVMTKHISEGKPMDLLSEAEPEAISDIANDRERKLADRLLSMTSRDSSLFDPVMESMSIFDDKITKYSPEFEWEKEDLSEKQREYLTRHGFNCSSWCKGYASIVMKDLDVRRQKGLCTPKQMRLLLNNGYSDAANVTFDEASRRIDSIMKKYKRISKHKRRRS